MDKKMKNIDHRFSQDEVALTDFKSTRTQSKCIRFDDD